MPVRLGTSPGDKLWDQHQIENNSQSTTIRVCWDSLTMGVCNQADICCLYTHNSHQATFSSWLCLPLSVPISLFMQSNNSSLQSLQLTRLFYTPEKNLSMSSNMTQTPLQCPHPCAGTLAIEDHSNPYPFWSPPSSFSFPNSQPRIPLLLPSNPCKGTLPSMFSV